MDTRKSVKLFAIWLAVCFAVGIVIGIASVIYSLNAGLSTLELPRNAKIAVGTFILVVFCPTLGFICRKAKQERVKPIYVISITLQILICVCVLSEIIPIIGRIWMH